MMKKAHFYFLFLSLFISLPSAAADKTFQGSGEVVSADPLYSRVTIETGAIKGYSAGGKNEFVVSSADLLKDISAHDLVDFEISEVKGEARIDKITKTGVAADADDGTPIGKAVQEVLTGTGQAVKTVTTPITPVGAAIGGVVGDATESTGNMVSDAKSDVKRKF